MPVYRRQRRGWYSVRRGILKPGNDPDTNTTTDSNIDIDPDAEIATYLRVKKKLDRLTAVRGIPIRATGRICTALDKLGSFPIFAFDRPRTPSHLKINGESIGYGEETPTEIKLDIILAKSSPENDNIEHTSRRIISGALVEFGYDNVKSAIAMECTITRMAFLSRSLSRATCKLRNLYLYSSGSGLDWRRESPLSDDHQGTALVALDTDWSGGCLLLRRNGTEIRHAMPHQVVFFDNETEYAIEPVTEGNLIILHYDILVQDREYPPPIDLDEEYTKDIVIKKREERSLFKQLQRLRTKYQTKGPQPRGFLCGVDHEKHMEYILRIVKKLLVTKYDTVGLALHHHYGDKQIQPDLLQQLDTWMYEAVAAFGSLDVSLRPVILYQETDDYRRFKDPSAYPYDRGTSSDVPEIKSQSAVLFLHAAAALTEVVTEDYIECHRPESEKHFAWAMFLRLKTDEMQL